MLISLSYLILQFTLITNYKFYKSSNWERSVHSLNMIKPFLLSRMQAVTLFL